MQFLDLKRDGPTIVEAPPGLLGGFSTMWQQSLIGLGPTGIDKVKGGKFLLLPPDYKGEAPGPYLGTLHLSKNQLKTMPTEVNLASSNCFYFFFFFIASGTLLSGRKTGLSDGQFSINSG
jgi:hypothetical protein